MDKTYKYLRQCKICDEFYKSNSKFSRTCDPCVKKIRKTAGDKVKLYWVEKAKKKEKDMREKINYIICYKCKEKLNLDRDWVIHEGKFFHVNCFPEPKNI